YLVERAALKAGRDRQRSSQAPAFGNGLKSYLIGLDQLQIEARLRSATVKLEPSRYSRPSSAAFNTANGLGSAFCASATASGLRLSGAVMNMSIRTVSRGFSTSVMPQKLHWWHSAWSSRLAGRKPSLLNRAAR